MLLLALAAASGANFTTGSQAAKKFGVHEISLRASSIAGNPFETPCQVAFTPPSGIAVKVAAFYDGGRSWRARVYVSETGKWQWRSECAGGTGLDGERGTFIATASRLRGMLRLHPRNPKHWMTDDGRWFLNIGDTAYRLFHPEERRWRQYLAENWRLGITSVRAGSLGGHSWGEKDPDPNYPWAGSDRTQYNLALFRTTEARLRWMLDHYPDLYVQLILFGSKTYGKDDTGPEWKALPESVRRNTMNYMLARWAAFPQLFWLIVNDVHLSDKFPNNRDFVREVGEYFSRNDPWRHLLSCGSNRGQVFPFSPQHDKWVSYIHIEDGYELGADEMKNYDSAKLHVFLGEDRYEQDRYSRDPLHPRYYFRWLLWSWLLSDGSAAYGGRWRCLSPYSATASIPYATGWTGADAHVYRNRLQGLDSVRFMGEFFARRGVELWRFLPDDALARDLYGRGGRLRPKLVRKDHEEYLIYHPNAKAEGKAAEADATRTAGMRLELRAASGFFAVEWYDPGTGESRPAANVEGGRMLELRAPWAGTDVVLYLKRPR